MANKKNKNVYYTIDCDVDVTDIYYITKKEYKKRKKNSTFAVKLKGKEKIKQFALQLLNDLGYLVYLFDDDWHE